jgi:TonB family protein
MLSNARAGEVEEKAFHYAIASYLQTHPLRYPADLLDLQTEGHVKVAFAVDRDGKLVDARITAGSGSTKADQDILDWLTHLQPFPKAPAEVSAPANFPRKSSSFPRSS